MENKENKTLKTVGKIALVTGIIVGFFAGRNYGTRRYIIVDKKVF